MLPRPIRAPIAALASFGLLVATTVTSSTAQTSTPSCTLVEATTEEVAEGVALTYDSSFACTDAADTGTWSITVSVANAAESTAGVAVTDATLSHTSPRPGGVGPHATATASGLPFSLAAGEQGTFNVGGDYALAETDEGDKANLHLRVNGVTDDEEPFALGVNVHILGPGVDPDGDGENGDAGADGERGAAEGRPAGVPGPPPWVTDMVAANMEAAAERAGLAEAHAEAIISWTACVAANAAARGDEEPPKAEPFDPKDGPVPCGDKPTPPDGALEDEEPEPATLNGPPEGTPQGPPSGTPQGPPSGTPQGPPSGTPQGPPSGTPQGPPSGTP